MGPPASYRVSRVRYYSGVTRCYLHFVYGSFTLCAVLFQNTSTMLPAAISWSSTPECMHSGLASFPFARRYLGNRCFFLFLRVLRCFSSPRFLLITYLFSYGYLRITIGEFPHSDICGSSDICSYPQLFAACHVLRRLPVPRHPPYALLHLTFVICLLTYYFVICLLTYYFVICLWHIMSSSHTRAVRMVSLLLKTLSGFLGWNHRFNTLCNTPLDVLLVMHP